MNSQDVTNRPRDLRLASERAIGCQRKYQLSRFGSDVFIALLVALMLIGTMITCRHDSADRRDPYQSMGSYDGYREVAR